MPANYAVVPFDYPTGTGLLNITSAGLGSAANMKAAILVVSGGTVLGTLRNDARLTIGFTDGTNARCVTGNDDDATVGASADHRATSLLLQGNRNLGTIDYQANFNAWIADGIQIDVVNGAEAVFKGFAILFNGTDVSANVGDFTGNVSLGGTTTVATVGFTSDVMFGMTADRLGGGSSNYLYSLGMLDFTSSVITQGCITRFTEDLSAPVELSARHANNRFLANINAAGNLEAVEITTVNATGFIATTRDSGGALTGCNYLCLNFNGALQHWVGTVTSPTATGNRSVTGVGFVPGLVCQLPSLVNTANTTVATQEADSAGISGNDGTNEQVASTMADDGATPNASTASMADTKTIHLLDGAKAAELVANHVSFDADGWTENYTVVDAVNSDQIVALALETSAAVTRVPDFMPFFE